MDEKPDDLLVAEARKGDKRAFPLLVQRHGPALLERVRRLVADAAAADDLYQQAWLEAWRDLATLRSGGSFRAWLLSIARNRCREHYRAGARREQAADTEALDAHFTRHGRALEWQRRACQEVLAALASAPPEDSAAARLFYLEGLSLREIATRQGCPSGTIKRRLFQARLHVRSRLGLQPFAAERRFAMVGLSPAVKRPPFPLHRPPVRIKPLAAKPFSVVTSELLWWNIIPEHGRTAWHVQYHACDGALERLCHLKVVRRAKIHRQLCWQIDVRSWGPKRGKERPLWHMFGRLNENTCEVLATLETDERDGSADLYTFLDKGFAMDWGALPRRFEDGGQAVTREDGSIELRDALPFPTPVAAGLHEVTVGKRAFVCLRLLEFPEEDLLKKGFVGSVSFLTSAGRSIYHSCYIAEPYRKKHRLSDGPPLIVNGIPFRRWCDTLSGLAFGIE